MRSPPQQQTAQPFYRETVARFGGLHQIADDADERGYHEYDSYRDDEIFAGTVGKQHQDKADNQCADDAQKREVYSFHKFMIFLRRYVFIE